MIYKNVLVPYDKSDHAKNALATALKLVSDDPEARVTMLYVTESAAEDPTFEVATRIAGVQKTESDVEVASGSYLDYKGAELRRSVADILQDTQNPVEIEIAMGKASHAILNYVAEHNIDLIVMGCRGLNAFQGMLGSVSYAVLRSAKVPVFIVK